VGVREARQGRKSFLTFFNTAVATLIAAVTTAVATAVTTAVASGCNLYSYVPKAVAGEGDQSPRADGLSTWT
jgi:hypothetical protein